MPVNKSLLQAIAVTAELTRTELSEAAARVMADELSRYPEAWVAPALARCRRELRGQLALADVLNRLEDGRPGAEEAWSAISVGESATMLYTEEMRVAWAAAQPLMSAEERVPARMAFKEVYEREITKARSSGVPVKWNVSLGHDPKGREVALLDAVKRGILPAETAQHYLPYLNIDTGQRYDALPAPQGQRSAQSGVRALALSMRAALEAKEAEMKAARDARAGRYGEEFWRERSGEAQKAQESSR